MVWQAREKKINSPRLHPTFFAMPDFNTTTIFSEVLCPPVSRQFENAEESLRLILYDENY
jgi:hypothetical protein